MAQSLQDQLMALGLATEDQLKKPKSGPPKGKKGRSGKKPKNARRGGGGGERANAGANRPRRPAQAAKPSKRQQNELSPEERAVRQQVHQLITDNHEKRGDDAETPYHFVKGSRIKRIYVTADQQRGLSANELAVAAMKGRHYIIPMPVAQQIRELIPQYYVSMGSEQVESSATTPESEIDDEYAGYEVPDDLMW